MNTSSQPQVPLHITSAINRKIAFDHLDKPVKPFSGEDVQQYGFTGKHRDWSINQYERPDEKKPGNSKDLKLQSCELKKSASNNQDSESQRRTDQNKTAETNKCNCRHQKAAREPPRPKEKMELQKTGDESEDDDPIGTEGISIRIGLCYSARKHTDSLSADDYYDIGNMYRYNRRVRGGGLVLLSEYHKCLQILEQSVLQHEGFLRMSFEYKVGEHKQPDITILQKSSDIRKSWAASDIVPSQRLQMASCLGIVPWLQAFREEVGIMRFLGTRWWKKWVNAEGIETPLEYAVKGGCDDAVRFLLDHGADREVDSYAIWEKAGFRRDNISKVLIEHGVMVGRSRGHKTPLVNAAREGSKGVVRELLNQGVNINTRNNENETALVMAAIFGHEDLVHFFLATLRISMLQTSGRGYDRRPGYHDPDGRLTDICWVVEDGTRLLILATTIADYEIVQLCLAKGVDINWKHPNGTTALIEAILEHRSRDPTYPDTCYLPLDACLENKTNPIRIAERWAVVAALLDHGADVNLCAGFDDGPLCPPLVTAAGQGVNWAVEKLIDHGADCNTRAKVIDKPEPRSGLLSSLFGRILPQPEIESRIEGGSALIYAARAGNTSTLRLLLAYGADTGLLDEHGKTALEWAYANGYREIGQVLMGHDEALSRSLT
ncbi:ankyrin repeat-containing domain protein [Fusarium sp. MPI-SDFR-AT-0072]|nr:ankyrin repeat-containing domain protein [Fusarium sp. MPI-SDFR-AT-0072]